MGGVVEKMIRRYGTSMTLVQDGQENTIRAFLQQTKSKGQNAVTREFTGLGESCQGVYLYIGPAAPLAQIGNELIWQERIFELRQAEPVMIGDDLLYCWGLCVEKGGEDTWGS